MGRTRYCIACQVKTERICYKFPKSDKLKTIWIDNLDIPSSTVKPHSAICAFHFKSDQMVSYRLKRDAIPQIRSSNKENECTNPKTLSQSKIRNHSSAIGQLILPQV